MCNLLLLVNSIILKEFLGRRRNKVGFINFPEHFGQTLLELLPLVKVLEPKLNRN